MKGVVLCLAADRHPLAGTTNTNERSGPKDPTARLIWIALPVSTASHAKGAARPFF
jgi:hypothetical protein